MHIGVNKTLENCSIKQSAYAIWGAVPRLGFLHILGSTKLNRFGPGVNGSVLEQILDPGQTAFSVCKLKREKLERSPLFFFLRSFCVFDKKSIKNAFLFMDFGVLKAVNKRLKIAVFRSIDYRYSGAFISLVLDPQFCRRYTAQYNLHPSWITRLESPWITYLAS